MPARGLPVWRLQAAVQIRGGDVPAIARLRLALRLARASPAQVSPAAPSRASPAPQWKDRARTDTPSRPAIGFPHTVRTGEFHLADARCSPGISPGSRL